MIPGEYLLTEGQIGLNEGRETETVVVTNQGDRPVQVGSHYHFFEVNTELKFERWKAYGRTSPPAPPCASNRASSAPSSW